MLLYSPPHPQQSCNPTVTARGGGSPYASMPRSTLRYLSISAPSNSGSAGDQGMSLPKRGREMSAGQELRPHEEAGRPRQASHDREASHEELLYALHKGLLVHGSPCIRGGTTNCDMTLGASYTEAIVPDHLHVSGTRSTATAACMTQESHPVQSIDRAISVYHLGSVPKRGMTGPCSTFV